ncbi:MAG TPA: zinc ribbon domain-containing protein [bacterium]|nr:zinc ribbon domain-containing protein [bacterium]
MVRLKEYLLKDIRMMLSKDEQILVAIPYGKVNMEPGVILRSTDQNYLLLTDKRVIDIKGSFFKNKSGFNAYPRRLVTTAEYRHYLMGCTIKICFFNEQQNSDVTIEFTNCTKPESEAIVKELTDQVEGRHCPKCMKKLKEDYTFCPYCRAVLKKLCSKCGKPQQKDATSCPYCGCTVLK